MSAAVQDSENENFGKVLEDQDLVAVRSGASLVESLSTGKQVKVTAEWISGSNSAVDGGGALQEGDAFFKRSRFTLYANVKFDAAHDNTSALLVGSDAGANFRIVPCKTDGTAVLKVNNGTEHKLSKAMTAGEWNALALVYAENDTEGTVAVYLNGEEVLPATGIGFKLSEKSGIVGAVGATFGTGFMRTGLYDELVVTGAADAEAAKVETAARKAAADAVVAVDGVVTVTGAEVEQAAQNVNGWTYKGLGMLNGNSTSNLLLDYKAESPDAYWAMMRYLFGGDYPLFSNIKMEMGNDGNNSTGAEACTMRYEDEEADASRSPGFVMAADAKTINPNVKVSILRWGCPNWVNAYKGTDWYAANYKWYKETIFDAFMLYNKKTIPTALTITGGFTILKTQRRLTTEKYATIGGSMVHILICDDDAAFAQDMAKKIQALPAYSPKSMNVQLLTDVTAMSAGVLTKFDILFLDIDLGNKNGIELARIMREHNAEAVLILVTNFSEYAPEGYEVNAFRYLSKAELDRKLPGYFSDALAVCRTRKRKVEIFCEGESMSVPVQAISYAESQGHEQCLYMIGWSKEKLYTRLTMAQLEELLFPQGFLRIHKQYLVNMTYLQSLQSTGAVLTTGKSLKASARNYRENQKKFVNWKAQQLW